MSRIYFHSEHGEAEVLGAERFHMAGLCGQMALVALDWPSHGRSPLMEILPSDCYLREISDLRYCRAAFDIWLRAGALDKDFHLRDGQVPVFDVVLNTALVLGSNAVKLCARLHGQCEIHTYVEGLNRAWLAGIIRGGLEKSILRKRVGGRDVGWSDVVALLESRNDGAVVTSYSVTEAFPRWNYEDDRESTWEEGMVVLRSQKRLEMKPDDWDAFYFESGVNGFQIMEEVMEGR